MTLNQLAPGYKLVRFETLEEMRAKGLNNLAAAMEKTGKKGQVVLTRGARYYTGAVFNNDSLTKLIQVPA